MRQASWYICRHSARGSTRTSSVAVLIAPSPGFKGCGAEARSQREAAPPRTAAPPPPPPGAAAPPAELRQPLLAVGGELEGVDAPGHLLNLALRHVDAM